MAAAACVGVTPWRSAPRINVAYRYQYGGEHDIKA